VAAASKGCVKYADRATMPGRTSITDRNRKSRTGISGTAQPSITSDMGKA
jgi:hypothetical protein